MKCSKTDCGRLLTSDDNFCPKCGTENKTESRDLAICSTCGKALRPEDEFCNKCGTKSPVCTSKDKDGNLCGYRLLASLSFCPRCGAQAPSESSKSDNRGTNIIQKELILDAQALNKRGDDEDTFSKETDNQSSFTSQRVFSSDTQCTTEQASDNLAAEKGPDGLLGSGGASGDGKASHGGPGPQQQEQKSADVPSPVTCTEDINPAEGSDSGGTLTSQLSKDGGSSGRKDGGDADPSQQSNICDENAARKTDAEGAGPSGKKDGEDADPSQHSNIPDGNAARQTDAEGAGPSGKKDGEDADPCQNSNIQDGNAGKQSDTGTVQYFSQYADQQFHGKKRPHGEVSFDDKNGNDAVAGTVQYFSQYADQQFHGKKRPHGEVSFDDKDGNDAVAGTVQYFSQYADQQFHGKKRPHGEVSFDDKNGNDAVAGTVQYFSQYADQQFHGKKRPHGEVSFDDKNGNDAQGCLTAASGSHRNKADAHCIHEDNSTDRKRDAVSSSKTKADRSCSEKEKTKNLKKERKTKAKAAGRDKMGRKHELKKEKKNSKAENDAEQPTAGSGESTSMVETSDHKHQTDPNTGVQNNSVPKAQKEEKRNADVATGFATRSKTHNAAKRSLPNDTNKATVIFQVIVSNLWEHMNPDKYEICLRCRPESLGSFEPLEDRHKMNLIGQTEIGFLYEGQITMDRDLRNGGFYYKYIAKKKSDGSDKVKFEVVHKKVHGRSQEIVDRRFHVPELKRSHTDALKEGFFDRLFSMIGSGTCNSKICGDAYYSAQIFLPSVNEIYQAGLTPASSGKLTLEGYLERIDQVMSSVKLQMLDASQYRVDESQVQKAIWDILVQPLESRLAAETNRTVALAVFLLLLIDSYGLRKNVTLADSLCRRLLISSDMDNTTCADIGLLESHFPTCMANKSNLAKKISNLMDKTYTAGETHHASNISWMFCIPLLHFLQDKAQPYQDVEPSPDFRRKDWWGLGDFERRKQTFKDWTETINAASVLEELKPAFQVDPLFVRTFVASFKLDPLLPFLISGIVPVDVMAATLTHHIGLQSNFHESTRQQIDRCMNMMICKLMDKKNMQHADLKAVTSSAKIIKELHGQLLCSKYILVEDTLLNGTYLMFLSLDHVAVVEDRLCQENSGVHDMQTWRKDAEEAASTTCTWLTTRMSYQSKRSRTLEMWDTLLSKVDEELTHMKLKQTVKELLAEGFEKELGSMTPDQKLEIYLEQYNMAPAFADTLNRLAFEALDAAFEKESKHVGTANQSAHLISLLSCFIEEKWREQVKQNEDVLKFVITWIPMVNYFKRFGSDKDCKPFSIQAAKNIKCALACLVHLVDDLTEGSIQIESLQLLATHRERFLMIVTACDQHMESVSDLLNLRNHELQSYLSTSASLDELLDHCKELFTVTDLPEILKKTEEVRDKAHTLQLSEVCPTVPPGTIKDLESYKPKSNPWKLSEDILAVLPVFRERITSYIFKKMFSEFAKKTDLSSVDFWRAFQVVWSNINKEWQELCKTMTEGTITLAEMQKVFSMFRTENGGYNYSCIKNELPKLSTHNDPGWWVDERIKQFSCFTSIQEHVKAATVLLKVREAVNISGDFEDIQDICSLSQDKNLPIRKVDQSVLRLCTQLQDVSPQDIKCMEDFLEPRCLEFVCWLQEKMKDGVKELNVFVDLAFISAGEEPWAIARVDYFYAATIGYAPLIFMETGEGCRHLLKQCRLVFANVAADPSLPAKLKDSSRFLDWFKDVEKSLGSVEKTCLSQVSSINERGVFRIGQGCKAKMTLPSVIQLKVSEDMDPKSLRSEDREKATPPRKYTYEELLDLQSRLMLVAGEAEKGKESVDRFITIMESLIRLGKTYVQLCRDGCVLFLDWTVEFLCDVKRPVCCISEFSSQGKLKGHRSTPGQSSSRKKEDLEEFIAGVAGFLEHCHKQWLSYLDQKRKDYPELNVFTVKQLVFLQQQLIKMGSDEVSKHVYPMLSLLKTDCSPQDLEQALQEAMDCIDSLQQHQQRSTHQQQTQQAAPVTDKETIENFMAEMRKNGFSKGLSQKALLEVGADDIAKGIAWCMKYEEDELSDEEEEAEEEDEESAPMEEESKGKMVGDRLREWVTRTETITECAIGWLNKLDKSKQGTMLRSLTGNLETVWRKFLETVSSSGMDFLSLEHLGIVLQCLAAKDGREFKRMLPPNLKPRIPNLILCPKNEVLNAVTYMYMFPEEEGTLLPQPDEVLLCTEHTTFEQVDIFLRRAFFGQQQKVHCLAYADCLDYDVGEKTEKKINEYSNLAGHHDWRLVVVCTTENEYRARIVAALEKFRQPSPALSTPEKVQSYLRSRFAGIVTKSGIKSASAVDPESLSVRVIKSSRSGVGKTLYKQRQTACLKRRLGQELRPVSITIPLHGRVAHANEIAVCLLRHTLDPTTVLPRIIHLDISYQVLEGVDHLLYSLLVLGCVTDSQGQVWLRSPMDLYLVETMPLLDHKETQRGRVLVHQIFDVLPSLSCWSPQDSLAIMRNPKSVSGYKKKDCLFDEEEFASDMYQRPFRYLQELNNGEQPAAAGPQGDTTPQRRPAAAGPQGDTTQQMVNCLALLLKYCGVVNPSWSEMTHFVHFLNKQLQDFEQSVYCGSDVSQDLPGFSRFVLRFLIQMSRDFATRSLKMREESLVALVPDEMKNADIEQYIMRRTWESSPHPYIFFNSDGQSMTFLGFSIDAATGNLVDHQTGQILENGIMSKQLYGILSKYRVPLSENFDILPREDRLLRLYRALGLHDEEIFDDNNQIADPDDTYELTTDNVKKILAIYMRFRCNIPVIVMGETGCGKTRLVRFLCSLQTPKLPHINTMVQVKVHGGTTGEDIIKKVHQAERLAQQNAKAIKHRPIYTVLFFDEANTTEAVGVIKEVMCDGTLDGQQMNLCPSLKMVAACNPYRKHSDELIERLENAGLGYHVDADKTVDKLGRVPMRRLVYRVQPLPQSMLPLVWDFGQLNTRVEELYIRQMVRRHVRNKELAELDETGMNVLCKILMESQEFMRQLADECSFVSLRDVDRALTVASWFLQQAQESRVLFKKLERKLNSQEEEEEMDVMSGSSNSEEVEEVEEDRDMCDMTKALVLSLGVCYRACLRSKEAYDQHIIPHFKPPFTLPDSVQHFALVIDRCQEVFLDSVRLADNIARNQALKENLFMMVVCIELRIPLFLVGKPGSSKSLAKTIVADAMQGNAAYSELFKTFKQAQMVSFQCSPLATADGILGTFRQCAKYQEGKPKTSFVSVVVLDEVGLAEDSPRMPLKTLHPLLEDGCPGDEVPDDSKKVAFIGISNWALDPAKMNRGILVQRDVPDQEELIETARGICTTQDQLALQNMNELVPVLAKAYLNIFQEAKKKREFFGLRDFYSLVKMVYTFAAQSHRRPSHCQLIAAIRRNFGGLDTIDPVESFRKLLPTSLCEEKPRPGDPDCSSSGLIKAALSGDDMGGETRYLLLLTENYGGLSILSENLLADRRVVPIFGSSFPKDQEYTQVCRNINRIKVCMETGQTVILLNLENLYESLYDALNQYYAMLGSDRFVDLGLGTHRVKCKVHRQFRLIVVAEKQAVYDKFPIPLINRLEKHFLTLNNIMTDEQLALAQQLEKWAQEFVTTRHRGHMMHFRARERKKEEVGDVFMGYHPDTASAIVLKVWDTLDVEHSPAAKQQVPEESQRMLLWCATPDAVVRSHDQHWSEVYHDQQQHEHLLQYLQHRMQLHLQQGTMLMAQVTTHAKLLTEQERVTLQGSLPVCGVTLLSLQAFDTEQQFCQQLRLFFNDSREGHKLLLVQCDCGDSNQNLIKGAQYCMQDLRPDNSSQHHVVFIIQLPSVAGACFTGFLGGNWHCLHIDDLRATDCPVPSITHLQSQTPGQLIMAAIPMETDQQVLNNPLEPMQRQEEDVLTEPEGEQVPVDIADVELELSLEPSPHEGTPLRAAHTEALPSAMPGEGPPSVVTGKTPSSSYGKLQPPAVEMTQPQGFSPQYVRKIFHSGVQAAVALVRDPEESSLRATRRIAILLDLLEENMEFFKGLHKLVAKILEEREQGAYEAECWLSKEAARLDTVKKAGTFRRSWMQYMEKKVVLALAGVIAYLDTNHNLDLHPALDTQHTHLPVDSISATPPHSHSDTSIQGMPAPEWVGEMWLAVLQEVCQLRYQNLRSMSDKDELEEFTVRHTGAGSCPVSARLPFSWLLWEFVERAISGAKSVEADLLDSAGTVVDQSPLGRCISKVLAGDEEKLQHMFQLYIADLLQFTFPLTPQLHQLLCVCVEKGLGQLHINLVQLEVGRGMVALHMLVEQMRPRLQAILDMATARPDAVAALQAGGAGGACGELLGIPDEMTEDVAMLQLMVEEVQPRPSQLDDEGGCQEWVAQYTTVAPIILRLLNDSDTAFSHLRTSEQEERMEEDGEEDVVDSLPYGDRSRQQLIAIRCLWTRVATLKLFLDFVGPLRQGPQKLCRALDKVKVRLLCNLLDDNVDMKRAESLTQVDDFLKRSNSKMLGSLLGKLGKCTYCEAKIASTPVELPCSHSLCNSCYRDSCHGNQADAKCPQCKALVPADFDPATAQNRDREAAELLGRYQRQISGFLMALVSQLSFAGKNPPEPAAIRHIFGYIIHTSKGRTLLQTKNMTVHDDLIDPTPVLRSFLLRLLLKHSEKEVYSHLEKFLENAQIMVDQEMAAAPEPTACPTLLEFCLLIIHCIEDLHHERDAVISTDQRQEERLLYLADTLQELATSLRAPPPMLLPCVYMLGRLRHALDACAHILHHTFLAADGVPVISEDLENLLSELKDVCQSGDMDWPKKFLVKQVCREYGIQDYMMLVRRAKQDDRLDWIILQDSGDQVEAVADRYLVCGDHYKTLRDLLAQVKLDGNSAELLQVLQASQLGAKQKETLLLLALHREVTMSVLYPTPDQARTLMVNNIRQLIQDCGALQDKALAQQLCDNQLGDAHSLLHVHLGQDLGAQSLLCVLTHLHLALRPCAAPAAPLLTPLSALAFQPSVMVGAFLPTMPQDNIQEVLAVIKEKVWQCPRGHRYFISDCGRPWEESVCPCGLKIGGIQHRPVTGNLENSGRDISQVGHILGPAAQRGLELVPERQLSTVECGVLRFFLHAVLYLSASTASQAVTVCQMVTPRIAPEQAAQFFLDHLTQDLKVLQRSLGRSADDVYLVLHHVCQLLASAQAAGPPLQLRTKEERAQWEQLFTPVFITPAIQNMDTIVRDGNQAILSDTRQGNNALLRVVYEDEDPVSGSHDVHQLPVNPAVWRFRPPITVDHFFRQFHLEVETSQDRKQAFHLLCLFKAQRHVVQALFFVPAILRGQRRLMMELHRRLDRAEAATLSVGEVMARNEHTGLEQLLSNFSKAWELVKEHLIGFQCVAPTEGVMVTLPEEFHNTTITRESPVALLLPSMQGPGLCSYIFLQFILAQNNSFLDSYSAILRQRNPEVPVRSITERHLVGCSVERDLLPMVLSHSNYSLMVGQVATLEYDFEAFQQQLQDTLLQCKARVERSPVDHFPVETMVYRADTTNSRMFKAVREKIPQECLSPAERRQIVENLHDLPDICQSIDNLNTALSFLKALGGDQTRFLHDFMTKSLKMRRTIYSRKAQQLCQLTHVQSLWLVLCHQRASILAAHQQDAFDGVGKELRVDMTEDQGKEVERMCQDMSMEQLELLLLQLFECIMLHLSEPRSQDDGARPENFKLREVLTTNLETPTYHVEPVEVRSGLLTSNDLFSFPESLQGRHSTATWMLCHAQLAHKRHMLL